MSSDNKNFDLCCRTCLRDQVESSDPMFDIFQEKSNFVDIAELIYSSTTIKVEMEDELPKKLCNLCYNTLLNFNAFKTTALQADAQLRDHFTNIQNKRDEEESNDVKIKQEHEYNQYQIQIGEDSIDSDIAVKQELNPFNEPPMYSDISDASQLEECQIKRQKAPIFKCNTCSKEYKSQKKLQIHKLKHAYNCTCNICGKSFKYNYRYVKHLLTHQEPTENSYKDEINHNADEIFRCDVCPAYFKTVNSLSAHKRKHTSKDRVLSCSICGKVFKKMSHLKRHELCHENNRPFKCSLCPKTFATEANLVDHLNKHNGIKPHCCPICTKSFAHLSTLTNHIKIHTREKPYLCPTCGKRFDASTNLNQHMKRHLGLKTYACNLCPRKFISKGELKSHSITHTGVQSYSCDQCNSKFTKRSSLTKHKLRHMDIKPYQCDACPMKFTSKYHLQRHNRIHTGERPYRCEICDRTFTQSNDLVKHTRSHLGNAMYKCNECSQSFRLKTELRQHISEHFISSQLQALKMTSEKPEVLIEKTDCIVKIPTANKEVESTSLRLEEDKIVN